MTIQTPREAAEAMYREASVMPRHEVIGYFTELLAARDRALLAEDEAAVEAMAGGIRGYIYVEHGVTRDKQQDREEARAALTALRRHHGVE